MTSEAAAVRVTQRRLDWVRPMAIVLAACYSLVRWYWALGGRVGLSLCDRTSVSPPAALATGCGADMAARLSLMNGAGAALLCTAITLAAVAIMSSRRWCPAVAGLIGSVVLIVVSFPGHLLFEIPASLDGRPTDWRDIANRGLLLLVGTVVGLAALTRLPRRAPAASLQTPARWVKIVTYAAAIVPVLGYTVPHLVWMAGIPLGIDPRLLGKALDEGLTWVFGLLCGVPVGGALLTVGLVRRWGQQLPSWVPKFGGRQVPRAAALLPASLAAMALIAYGAVGIAIVTTGLVDGSIRPEAVTVGWAVTATELVFFLWGILLAAATAGYYLTTSRQPGSAVLRTTVPS